MIYDLRGKPTGADEAFPFFVYGIQLSKIQKLKSNLIFIEYFRHFKRFEGEEYYYFTTINSAVQYFETLSPSDVKLKESTFEELKNKELKIRVKEMDKLLSNSSSLKSKIYDLNLENNDEAYLLYYLNNNKHEENSNYVELTDFIDNESINVSKTLQSSLIENENALAIFKINLDKLNKEYFSDNLNKLSFSKMEKMYNDFKILIMLIENFKNSFKLNKFVSKNKMMELENENMLDGKLSLQSKMNSVNENESEDFVNNNKLNKDKDTSSSLTNGSSYSLNILKSLFGKK